MADVEVKKTAIPGLLEINLLVNEDERGSFTEYYKRESMEGLGLPKLDVKQANTAISNKRGVIRGFHAEPWNKLVYVAHGNGLAVIADIRADSPTFGKTASFELDGTRAIFVPKGLGNSVLVLEAPMVYNYLTDGAWDKSVEEEYRRVYLGDPDLGFDWPIPKEEWIISERDERQPSLRELFPEKFKK